MVLHKPVSLADQVFERLETDILTEKYPKGAILTENGLSEELGVSRTPVREALSRLEQEHLIEAVGKGVRVIGITEDDILVHDAHTNYVGLHMALADMKGPDYPVALGVIRDVKDITYDDGVRDQVKEVTAKAKIHNMDELLHSGSTWEVK